MWEKASGRDKNLMIFLCLKIDILYYFLRKCQFFCEGADLHELQHNLLAEVFGSLKKLRNITINYVIVKSTHPHHRFQLQMDRVGYGEILPHFLQESYGGDVTIPQQPSSPCSLLVISLFAAVLSL